jgi:hypothetical protein
MGDQKPDYRQFAGRFACEHFLLVVLTHSPVQAQCLVPARERTCGITWHLGVIPPAASGVLRWA